MEFKQALITAEKNAHLVGKAHKGATIDEIIIYPTEENQHELFINTYYQGENAQAAIIPFINMDVEVGIIMDKGRMASGILLWTDIRNLPEDLEVEYP